MVSTWKEIAGTNRTERSAAIRRTTTHHHEWVHDAREDGWERTYAYTEGWCDTEGWTSDTDGEWWTVDGVMLLFYDNLLLATCSGGRGLRLLRGGTGVDRRWRWLAVDIRVVADVGEPRLTERRATRH
jgi:hypothetical protein